MTIPFSTNSNIVISKYAIEGLKKIFKKGVNYKKAGTIVMGLDSSYNHQLNLFENEGTKQELHPSSDRIGSVIVRRTPALRSLARAARCPVSSAQVAPASTESEALREARGC